MNTIAIILGFYFILMLLLLIFKYRMTREVNIGDLTPMIAAINNGMMTVDECRARMNHIPLLYPGSDIGPTTACSECPAIIPAESAYISKRDPNRLLCDPCFQRAEAGGRAKLTERSDGPRPGPGTRLGLLCLLCNRVSWNPNDVVNLYCGCCHAFLGELRPAVHFIYVMETDPISPEMRREIMRQIEGAYGNCQSASSNPG